MKDVNFPNLNYRSTICQYPATQHVHYEPVVYRLFKNKEQAQLKLVLTVQRKNISLKVYLLSKMFLSIQCYIVSMEVNYYKLFQFQQDKGLKPVPQGTACCGENRRVLIRSIQLCRCYQQPIFGGNVLVRFHRMQISLEFS